MSLRLQAAILSIIFLCFCARTSRAQNSDGVTGYASARIIEPVTVKGDGTDAINFGSLKTGNQAGTIKLDAETDDYGTKTGGMQLKSDDQERHAAKFRVTGEPGLQFQVTITNTSTTSPGTISNLHVYPETHEIKNNGKASFKVGGTLSLPARTNGFKVYKSQIAVTVSYN